MIAVDFWCNGCQSNQPHDHDRAACEVTDLTALLFCLSPEAQAQILNEQERQDHARHHANWKLASCGWTQEEVERFMLVLSPEERTRMTIDVLGAAEAEGVEQ